MSMRFIQRSSKLLVAAAVVCSFSSMAAEAATIVPTGGSLGNMTPDVIPAQYGTVFAYREFTILRQYFPDPAWYSTEVAATISTTLAPNSLSLSGMAYSYMDAQDTSDALDDIVVSGSMGGTIGFDLTESATTRFSLSQMPYAWTNDVSGVSITLRDAVGSIVFGCIGEGFYYNVAGGCRVGSQPQVGDQNADLLHDGLLQLGAGHYELSFFASGQTIRLGPSDTQFDFKLTTVPLPASAWLLVSGLGLLARRRRRASVEA